MTGVPARSRWSNVALNSPQSSHQLREGEVRFSDAIGKGELRPALALKDGASFQVPVVLATKEHDPLPAGFTPENDATRDLQLRTMAHADPP